jgi:hypothetical protein
MHCGRVGANTFFKKIRIIIINIIEHTDAPFQQTDDADRPQTCAVRAVQGVDIHTRQTYKTDIDL